jgi:hypothetical protein
MRLIKQSREILEPLLLHIFNLTVTSGVFPTRLKNAKIVPLLKKLKPRTEPRSFRPLNLLPAISKLLERGYSLQLTAYLDRHQLVPAQHHGGRPKHSTTTAVATIVDHWAQLLEDNIPTAVIALDQSAAYDIICHKILLKKLRILGFNNNTLNLFRSYLEDRTQQVSVDGALSEKLHIGPMSVVQGSILSCLLFLLYTLDLPLLLHESHHTPRGELECKKPSTSTFVDDWIISIQKMMNTSLQTGIDTTMETIADYMAANKLVLNKDKTKLMVVAQNPDTRKSCRINDPDPELVVKPEQHLKMLGLELSNNLKFNYYIADSKASLIKALMTRINMLKLLSKTTSKKTMLLIATGIFQSKLLYGIEVWGVAPKYLLKKVQSLQLEALRVCNGPSSQRWNTTTLLKSAGWLSIFDLIKLTNAKLTHKIIHGQGPTTLTNLMTADNHNIETQRTTRRTGPNKAGNPPVSLGRTLITRGTYRYTSYQIYSEVPEVLKRIKKPTLFKRRLKRYLVSNDDLPYNRCKHVSCNDNNDCTSVPLYDPISIDRGRTQSQS